MNNYPTVAEWVGRLHLRRSGAEWKGPCPLCGGTDRFHVKQGHSRVLASCRQCQAPIKALHEATFGSTPTPLADLDPHQLGQHLDDLRKAARMRRFAEQIHGKLYFGPSAAGWARRRGLTSVRLAAKGWRSIHDPTKLLGLLPPRGISWPKLPSSWDSLLLMPIKDLNGLHSYRIRVLDGGRPLSFKGARGALYNLAEAEAARVESKIKTLHVAEGETDTESLIQAGAKCVIGVPGCASLHDAVVEYTLRRYRKVVIWFDSDHPGSKAALRLAAKLQAKRKLVLSVPWHQLGLGSRIKDANDILRSRPALLRQMVSELS